MPKIINPCLHVELIYFVNVFENIYISDIMLSIFNMVMAPKRFTKLMVVKAMELYNIEDI